MVQIFLAGRCKRGQSCSFRHDDHSEAEEPVVEINDEELEWPVTDWPAVEHCRPACNSLDPVYQALVDKVMGLGAEGCQEARLYFQNHDCPKTRTALLEALDEAAREIQKITADSMRLR